MGWDIVCDAERGERGGVKRVEESQLNVGVRVWIERRGIAVGKR